MSKSIEQIDALISKAVRNAKTERELAVKGFNFGRWWNDVGELENAAKWVTKYLTIYDKDAKAHKFLGEIYEKLDKSDAALGCFKSSLRVKPQQYELMLKVAEMHINPGPTQDPGRAQVWLDKAAAALPENPQVYKLKMELFLAQEASPSKLEDTILEELKKRPADPTLYVQYVSFLKDQEKLDEAFAYTQMTDHNNLLPKAVERDLEWNQCIIDTCQEFIEKMSDEDDVTTNGLKAHSLLLVSLSRHVWLCFEQEKYDSAIDYLAQLDTTVFSALSLRQDGAEGNLSEWRTVLVEVRGQLYWLAGIALIHFANQNEASWAEATRLSAACFAVSLSYPIPDVSETWASWSRDTVFAERLKCMGGLRLSQSAHMMHNLASTSHTEHRDEDEVNEREWLRDVDDNFCTEEGRHKLFGVLFGQNYNPETSMIYSDEKFESVSASLVPEEDLSEYDASAALGADLRTWVWMGIQWKQNFDALDPFSWISLVFSDLQLAPPGGVKHGNVWNLYRLDVESFIVACVLYGEKAAELWKRSRANVDNDALSLTRLPLPLGRRLTIDKQIDWWEAACKLHYRKNREKVHNANQVKATLRHGIEAIRGSGNHGLQLTLMTGLAKHFSAKAYALDKSGLGTSSVAWLAYQRRASHYWSLAHPLMHDVANNRARRGTEPKDRLFPCTFSDLTPQEATSMMSEVYMCNGGLLVQEGDLKSALEMYRKADTPHASFCEALIFKQLVENCDKQETTLTPESSGKRREAFVKKCLERLEVTLNRLEREPDEELCRRTEAMMHDQDFSASPSQVRSRARSRDVEPKRLFEDTIRKHSSPRAGSRTVNSDVEESVLPGPSRQSTPKNDSRSQTEDLGQFAKSLTTLTTALSTMQVNIMERLNKVEQAPSPVVEGAKKEQVMMENLSNQLEKLTTVVSGLQENKEAADQREKALQRHIDILQEQLGRSQQLNSPSAQAFEQYQRASLAHVASPMPPYHGGFVPPYQGGFVPQHSASVPAIYGPHGYPAMPPGMPLPYGSQARTPHQILDPRDSRSPSIAGLPMSKEGADALSMRFQSSMGGRTGSITPPFGSTPPEVLARMRSTSPRSGSISYPAAAEMEAGTPESSILRRMTQAMPEAPHGLLPGNAPWTGQQMHPGVGPRPMRPTLQPQGTSDGRALPAMSSMLPPGSSVRMEGRKSVFQSLFPSGQIPPDASMPTQPGINYPSQYDVTEKKDETGGSNWNFKFPSPEEMDKDNKKLEADEEAEDADTSHNDTGPHFEPLVTLPEVEVVTGEEDEEAVFSERAKLYRYHEGQWKERGLGTMKILKHRKNGKCRLLMRRDQVFKICCNHIIGKFIELKQMPNSDRAWVWQALDFSEETGKQEMLAIRFKNPEIANQFKQKFIEGQDGNAKLSETSPGATASANLPEVSRHPQGVTSSAMVQPGMAPPATPYLALGASATARPGDIAATGMARLAMGPSTIAQTGDMTTSALAQLIRGPSAMARPGDMTGSAPAHAAMGPSPMARLGDSTSSTMAYSAMGPPAMGQLGLDQPSVGRLGTPNFQFSFGKPIPGAALDLSMKIAGGSPKQPAAESPKSPGDGQREDEDVHNDTGDGPHFEPVISLPDKVETKTGEEDEEVLFSYRAKLYRYFDKQWKERGLGDIKILCNEATKKCRIVMRREQVLKLCANHYIGPEMTLAPLANSDKAWTWTAVDHSDPECPPQQEFLAVRFKLAETAADFARNFNRAKDIVAGKAEFVHGDATCLVSSMQTPTMPTFTSSTSPGAAASLSIGMTQGPLTMKKDVGSWSCSTCYALNAETDLVCPCCNEPNPNAPTAADASQQPAQGTVSQPSLKFSFGIPSSQSGGTSFSFGVKQTAVVTPASNTSTKSVFGGDQAPSAPFSFGIKPTALDTPASHTCTKSDSPFGSNQVSGSVKTSGSKQSPNIATTGLLKATKELGKWSCPDCYAENNATDFTCPCCNSVNPAATPPKTTVTTGLFGVMANQKSNFSFGLPQNSTVGTSSVQAAHPQNTQTQNNLGSTKTADSQIASSRPLIATKAPGKWNCPVCYAENNAGDAKCPCCQADNPSASVAAPRAEEIEMKPGLFSLLGNQTNTQFGTPQSSTPSQQPQGSVFGTGGTSAIRFPFGTPGSTSFTFATPGHSDGSKNNNNANSRDNGQPSMNTLFSTTLSSNLVKPTEISPKPRFPSVGHNDDETDDDESDDSNGSNEGYELSEEEEDGSDQDRERYRSPLNRPPVREQQNSAQNDEDGDVVCLGEILPSKELQEKAKSLMLPKQFYNFLKNGESCDDDNADTDEEKDKPTSKVDTVNPQPLQSTFESAFSGSSTFATIAAQNSGDFASGGTPGGGWVGMPKGKTLFADAAQHDSSLNEDGQYKADEGDNIHFEPVIELPEKVETVTGEEDEEALFSARCKLYRFNKPTNEWKERGLGEIKLLRHQATGRIRIVMRREQVLKVCANHYIRPGMSLDVNKTSDRAWTWTAMDHSDDDGEPKVEIFTARFKTTDIANDFKEKFDMCQTMLLDVNPMTPCKASSLRTQELSQKAEQMKDELRFFKDKFSQPFKVDLENTLTDETALMQKPLPPVGSLTPLVRQHAENLRQSAGDEQAGDDSIIEALTRPTSVFGGDNTFSFQLKKTNCEVADSASQARQHTVSVGSDDPQAEKEIHFEPVIPLPEKVELVTGEENEQVIFANRAKLYAFHKATSQWKERGLGDVKILQDLKSYKARVVMRREQVFKVCLNHHIQPEINLSFKDPNVANTVVWMAKDYSDEENPDGEICQFALRFKNSEFASSFKDLWEEASVAVISKTVLEPNPAAINVSMTKRGVMSPGPSVPQSPESPVKQPTSTFSFANVPSPFKPAEASTGDPVNVMGFVFGKQPENSVESTGKFTFDTSKLSFSFGTSTPQTFGGTPADGFYTPVGTFSEGRSDGSQTQNTLYVTSSETPPRQETVTTSDRDQTLDLQAQQSQSSQNQAPQPQTPSTTSDGDQSLSSQPQQNQPPRNLFGTARTGNVEAEYKPSPLAMNSDLSKSGAVYSAQSGKYQFKPAMNEQIPQKVVDVQRDTEASSTKGDEDDDDVVFVSELVPSADQRKRAMDLLLPPAFFLYENNPDPPGYNEKSEDEKEENVFKFIEDRDSGKLILKKQEVTQSVSAGDEVGTAAAEPEDQWVFGGGSHTFGSGSKIESASSFGDVASFANLATGVQNVGFKKDPSFQFPGAGQMLFQQLTTATDANDGQDPSLFKCDAQFKPVLAEPPPLVESKTGEEGEAVLFKERCKLYRYDTEAKAWKERGVGEIKILRNDEHALHRVVMRRDQVFKVCTNHVITENTNPEAHLGSTKSCSYFVMDYSESKIPTPERIAIRFKTDELCTEYMNKIYEIKTSGGLVS